MEVRYKLKLATSDKVGNITVEIYCGFQSWQK